MADRNRLVYDQGRARELARQIGENELRGWGLDWPPGDVPWPGAYCSLRTRRIIIPSFYNLEEGEVL